MNTPFLPRPRRLKIFASQMYEGMLLLALVFVTSYIFDSLTQRTDPHYLYWISQTVLFVVIGAYFVLSWYRKSQTLPMKTWGIKLVNRDQSPPTIKQLIIRYITAWIFPLIGAFLVHLLSDYLGWKSITMLIVFAPFLNFIYSWFDGQGLFLHDRLSKTLLIDTKPKE
ncbi:RDD family protein 2 [Pelistega indica]|uniref:RDD family protein 2 n=1 Tax=Pelistega indica TaxID=1414851 RepID=V8GA88_9BURK|nr:MULTISPECIES: RDD family protein [Pelistega]ETD73011.1 RDD family protein 2 [Pelistega indica]